MPRSIGLTTLAVLRAIAAGSRYGFDLCDATKLPSGTVYPALATLERRELVRSHWEDDQRARLAGRPRRRYYEITASGVEALEAGLDRIRALNLGEEVTR